MEHLLENASVAFYNIKRPMEGCQNRNGLIQMSEDAWSG
jgi:hypothetical protein